MVKIDAFEVVYCKFWDEERVKMNFAQTQAAIDLRQKCFSMEFGGLEYTSPESKQLFGLSDLMLLSQMRGACDYQAVGEIKVRDWRCQRSFSSLDEALAGGRQKWLLAGYYISEQGLVMSFLPRGSARLQNEASELELELRDLDEVSYREWASIHTENLYSEYATKLVLTGHFQFWFNSGKNSSDVVVCNDRMIRMLSIEGRRKVARVTFPFAKGRKPRQLLYS